MVLLSLCDSWQQKCRPYAFDFFRGRLGIFCWELMDWLDQNGHGYLIKVKLKGACSPAGPTEMAKDSRLFRMGTMRL